MLNAKIAPSGADKIITGLIGLHLGFKRSVLGRLRPWGLIITGCIALITGGLIIPISQAHATTPSETMDHGDAHGAAEAGGHGADRADAHPAHGPTQGQTAGDLMQSDMATFDALSLVADVVADFKARQAHGELPATIYVVDSLGEFLGTLSTSRLLMAEPESVLDLLISGDPVFVAADAGVAEILTAAKAHNLSMIPVTDAFGRLVGVVDARNLPANHKTPSAAVYNSGDKESHSKDSEPVDHGVGHSTLHPTEAQEHAPSGDVTETAAHPSEPMMHAAAVTGHDAAPGAESHGAPPEDHAATEPHAAPADIAHGTAQSHPNATPQTEEQAAAPHGATETHEATAGHGETADAHGSAPQAADDHGGTDAHGDPHGAAPAEPKAKGVAFVEATIKPLSYELNDRFYGWRPNDIFDFSDNANNFQLGVLEVTRRSVVILAERISRTGAIEAFDENVENAMNWLMIKAGRYWLPSPESKYQAAMDELSEYARRLEKSEAGFYNRTDNLIPLLAAYEDLLGSCEENLVKHQEDDGSAVSFFKADDYFFYALGAASAMGTILSAIHQDFHDVLVARNGLEVLHHAVESCHHAIEINPWVITDSSYSGIFANHRANLAAPISHARFYIGVLIKTLST